MASKSVLRMSALLGAVTTVVVGAAVATWVLAPTAPAPASTPASSAAAPPTSAATPAAPGATAATPAATPAATEGTAATSATSAKVTYTFAGDSVTQANNTWSWTKYVRATRATSVGGVASAGATSATIAASAVRRDADVLVVMIGVDDVRFGVSPTTVRRNVSTIVGKVHALHVVIAAIPPCNLTDYGPDHVDRATAGYALNRSLQEYASSRGWGWVDPFSSVRRVDGTWTPGASFKDGVHPAVATAKTFLGPRMTVAITQAVAGAKP